MFSSDFLHFLDLFATFLPFLPCLPVCRVWWLRWFDVNVTFWPLLHTACSGCDKPPWMWIVKAIGYLFRLNEGGQLLVTTFEMEITAVKISDEASVRGSRLSVSGPCPHSTILYTSRLGWPWFAWAAQEFSVHRRGACCDITKLKSTHINPALASHAEPKADIGLSV